MWKFLINPLYWPIGIVLICLWCIAHLPFRVQLMLGRGLGYVCWIVGAGRKRIARINIDHAFAHESAAFRQQLLKKHMISLGVFFMELVMSLFAPRSILKKRLRIYGIEHFHAALAAGRGGIGICPHFMCVELVGRLFSFEESLAVVYRPQKIALLEWLNQKLLRCYPRAIARDDVRGIVKALRDNFPLFYTPDVDRGHKQCLFVPFFGVPASTLTALPRLAKISGARVAPVSFFRVGDTYEVHFEPALENFPSGDDAADLLRVNQILERLILQKPEQYLWSYKRYKTRPPGEPRFY